MLRCYTFYFSWVAISIISRGSCYTKQAGDSLPSHGLQPLIVGDVDRCSYYRIFRIIRRRYYVMFSDWFIAASTPSVCITSLCQREMVRRSRTTSSVVFTLINL